jgi:hypothetical protein
MRLSSPGVQIKWDFVLFHDAAHGDILCNPVRIRVRGRAGIIVSLLSEEQFSVYKPIRPYSSFRNTSNLGVLKL